MKLNVVNLGKVAITVEEKPWNIHRSYDRLTIVEDNFTAYISRISVPKDTPLTNRRYWVPFGTRSAVSVNAFTILSNISDLPTTFEDNHGPYLISGVGYFWVGTNGDTLNGKYQSLQLTGPKGDTGAKGDTGEKGDKGDQGESAYEAAMRVRASQGLPRLSLDDWITSLKGENGKDGKNGSPGQNGQDGKDGQDGAPGANGAPGKDGRDGYTPYIGDNGNWWINGVDTGKPSRGRDGASGEGGSASAYIRDGRIYIPINTGGNLPNIVQPLDGMTYSVTLTVPYVTILVLGSNITANTLLTVSNTDYFILSKGDDTPSPSIILTPEEVIAGVEVKCTFTSSNLNDSNRTHSTSIIITSANQEYSQKIIKVNYSLPNRPDISPSGGLTPANPNS